MIRKIGEEILDRCRKSCLSNELIVVPPGIEDAGLVDYFAEKTAAIKKEKNLPGQVESCGIMLQFPRPTQRVEEVYSFFDSPRAFNRNRPFFGCFMVDISFYADYVQSDYFELLKTFIAENSDNMVFLLVVESDDQDKINRIRKSLSSCGIFILSRLEAPTADAVVDYILVHSGEMQKDIAPMREFFTKHPDFRIADNYLEFRRKHKAMGLASDFHAFVTDFNSFNTDIRGKKFGF